MPIQPDFHILMLSRIVRVFADGLWISMSITLVPTDTCYGLAWDFTEKDYYELYRLKGRDFHKKLAVVVRDFSMLDEYAEITASQKIFLQQYPYPWTVLLPRKNAKTLPPPLWTEEYKNIAFRVAEVCFPAFPHHQHSYPLFLTSANRSGESEATTLEQWQRIFPWIQGIDGWSCDHVASDIFRFLSDGTREDLRKNY